jgi:hypothetical protein
MAGTVLLHQRSFAGEFVEPAFGSMGGHLAPDLALACPDEYAAVIGLEAGLKTGVGTDDDIRAAFRYFRHPRVNGADRAAAAMYCINGPRSPEKYKREVAWSYSQGRRAPSRAI